MHELMIFFGTLGGIAMFGVVGIIIGPIITVLFTTIWDVYAIAFEDILPKVILSIADQTSTPPEPQPDHNVPNLPSALSEKR